MTPDTADDSPQNIAAFHQGVESEKIEIIKERLEYLRTVLTKYHQSDLVEHLDLDLDDEMEARGSEEITNSKLDDITTLLTGQQQAEMPREYKQLVATSFQEPMDYLSDLYKLEELTTDLNLTDYVTQMRTQLEHVIGTLEGTFRPERAVEPLVVVEPEEHVESKLALEVIDNTDTRDCYALVPATAFQHLAQLETLLKNIDQNLTGCKAYFHPKKTDEVLSQILYLEKMLFLEPEKRRNLTNRFMKIYTMASACFGQELGFTEQIDKYITENMETPEEKIEFNYTPEEPKTTWIQRNSTTLSRAGDVASGGAGILIGTLFFGPLGTVIAGAAGIGAKQITERFTKFVIEENKRADLPPEYIPGMYQERGSNPYNSGSEEYKAKASAYDQTTIFRDLEETLDHMRESLSDHRDRGINPQNGETKTFNETSRSFLANIESIYDACIHYADILTKRQQVHEELRALNSGLQRVQTR